jgi:hypothetical protein
MSLLKSEPVERFDPEGFPKEDPGGSGDRERFGNDGKWRGKRVPGVDIAPLRPRNRTERKSRESNGSANFSGVGTKVQARNIDLAMVADWWRASVIEEKRRCERAKGRIEIPAPAGC